LNLGARLLVDGTGLVDDSVFYVSTRSALEKHRQILQIVVEEIEKTEGWMETYPDDAARQLADGSHEQAKMVGEGQDRVNLSTARYIHEAHGGRRENDGA
jgi:ABC-type nitrate/sulfonate/bicarbonate transport system substrate-binding protein